MRQKGNMYSKSTMTFSFDHLELKPLLAQEEKMYVALRDDKEDIHQCQTLYRGLDGDFH